MSIGFWSWSQSSAVSSQVTEAINPVVGCHYFPPGPQLPLQLSSITAHWLVPNYTAWWQRHVCKQLVQGCTRQLVFESKTCWLQVWLPNHSAEPSLVDKCKTVWKSSVCIWQLLFQYNSNLNANLIITHCYESPAQAGCLQHTNKAAKILFFSYLKIL